MTTGTYTERLGFEDEPETPPEPTRRPTTPVEPPAPAQHTAKPPATATKATTRAEKNARRNSITTMQLTNPIEYDAIHGEGAHRRDLATLWKAEEAQADLTWAEAAKARAAAETGTTGNQTFATLPYGKHKPQLVPPFLNQTGPTVLYGPGGVGKGMTSVYLVWQLVNAGLKVMVIDFENNDEEWGRRARNMGYSPDDLTMVAYRAPFSTDWTAPKGSLHDIADLLRQDCDDHGIDYLVIDSYVAATSTGDAMGGSASAQEFFNAITRIGRPALVLAHVTGAASRFPDKPFGSVFVHNYARETWSIEKTSTEDEEPYDPTIARVLPYVMSVELRNKKMSNGPTPRPQFLSFSFFSDDHIEVDQKQPDRPRKTEDLINDVLSRSTKPMTADAIAKVIKLDTGETVKPETLRKTLNRHFHPTDEVPHRWTKRPQRGD